jgi:hypothetical protein
MLTLVTHSPRLGSTPKFSGEDESDRTRTPRRPPTIRVASSLIEIYSLADNGRIDAAIDAAIGLVDALLSQGRFVDVDDLLKELDIDNLHTDVSVALLIAVRPARDLLRTRNACLERLSQRLIQTEPSDHEQIMQILE